VRRFGLTLVMFALLAAPAAARTLTVGSRGKAVKAVQVRLGLPADGIYGKATARAVRHFQRRAGLPVTGAVDTATRDALFPPTSGGTAPGSMDEAVRAALGKPYRAGAAGPDAFDCSGLVVWAAAAAGIDLPRSSYAQYKTGTPVDRADIAPGDLVFFDTNGSGASDVGIAVGPDAAISATTHGVRDHSISGAYWGEHYVGARRL
jgi:cell wall-associated NlpC family hydrolase